MTPPPTSKRTPKKPTQIRAKGQTRGDNIFIFHTNFLEQLAGKDLDNPFT